MLPIQLFNLAAQHNRWLSTKQALVAQNVANANTPGYKALELQPFEAVLQSTQLTMKVTEAGHMAPPETEMTASTELANEKSWDVYHSGDNVSLEQEMIKANDINRAYSLDTNIVKAFHQMLLTSAKPGS
jgi:flagellar basal-body rod protein FlgB